MTNSGGRRRVGILLGSVALVGAIFLWAGVSLVRSVLAVERRAVTEQALERQGVDPPGTDAQQIEALVEYVLDDTMALEERSSAIWLLGRLRAAAAEDPLAAFVEGEDCAREPGLCQDEVRKALRRIRGEDGAFSRLGDLIDGYD